MTDQITITGLVATDPRNVTTGEGLSIASFRLASTQRRFDRGQNRWVDGETNWYTVTAFRQLAHNVSQSVKKGERIVVTGRLRIRAWVAGPKNGVNIEVDADAVGHDLTWGTSRYERTISTASAASANGETIAGPDLGDALTGAAADLGMPPLNHNGIDSVPAAGGETGKAAETEAGIDNAGWALPLATPASTELPADDGVPF